MPGVSVGDFRVTLVRAGVYHWDGGAFFGVVPKTLWSRRFPPDERNLVRLAFNCYVVETGEHTALIETGGGDKMDDRARERMKLSGRLDPLPELISRQGIDPERVDIVINTHLHWDHCGWNTILDNGVARPLFPRATYYTRRGEWEHAHDRHPRDSVSYIDSNYDPLVESGRMKLLDNDAEVVPGIGLHLAPGHNRDMLVATASSGGETFCFFSDLVPSAAHLTPTWVAAFDLYPLECIDTKTRWLSQAAREKWFCGFGHDCDVAFARVEQIDGKHAGFRTCETYA
jgi:glyoxylase-like metal-dependent hydrolase (beta-lactamase superfamily II)